MYCREKVACMLSGSVEVSSGCRYITCRHVWVNGRSTNSEKSFWLTWSFLFTFTSKSSMCVFVCVFLHPSDFRLHWRKEKKLCQVWKLVGLFVASTLGLLHCVLQESSGTGGLLCHKVCRWRTDCAEAPPSSPPSCQGVSPNSRASTSVHHHGGNLAIDDLLFAIKVEHVDRRHLCGGATGARRPSGVGLVHQVGVGVLLQVHVLTLPGAVVGLVALWGNNPVPAKVFKVHCERVATASGLWGVLVTVQTRVSPDTLGALGDLHLHEWLLEWQRVCEHLFAESSQVTVYIL